jgi:hypothetical protein
MAFSVVTYSKHARERMEERNISRQQVEQTLFHPDTVRLDKGVLIAERETTAGNTIRVVYREVLTNQGQAAHVITTIRIAGR